MAKYSDWHKAKQQQQKTCPLGNNLNYETWDWNEDLSDLWWFDFDF